SIQDFISIPLGEYVRNNLEFGRRLRKQPIVFGVNYFLRDLKTGEFLNDRRDKQIWMKWMELRVHKDVDAIKSPTGWIPKYEDLKRLFREVRGVEYSKEDYVKQFTTRVRENLAKINRVERFFKENAKDMPQELFEILEEQRARLTKVQRKFGNYVSPENLKKEDWMEE
ncbi:MAG: phosphoenolpyruvate carboxykinase domain-containing protein, partial [Candidatus Jordarchaeales archaeon]